uniref:ZP domain-containing protein n=1 Tax=Angiostrongylus cantonensis TaxID=6313 RepID=A0A0K0DKZ6_ANGCA
MTTALSVTAGQRRKCVVDGEHWLSPGIFQALSGGEIIAVAKMYVDLTGCFGKKSENALGKFMFMIARCQLLSRGPPAFAPGVSHDGDKNLLACPPAPRRQPQRFRSVNVTPLSVTNPYITKWRICGLRTTKEPLKTTEHRNGAGDIKSKLDRRPQMNALFNLILPY